VQTSSSRRVETYPMKYSGQKDAKAKSENMTWRENEQTASPRRVESYLINSQARPAYGHTRKLRKKKRRRRRRGKECRLPCPGGCKFIQ
jgi:hypothetical protein